MSIRAGGIMIILKRFEYETLELEEKLSGIFREQHQAIVQNHMGNSPFSLSRYVRRVSATIWNQEQTRNFSQGKRDLGDPEKVQAEILEEVRAVVSDYGTLSLCGLRLLLSVVAIWLLLQTAIDLRPNLTMIMSLVLISVVVYPIVVYRFWNNRVVHPFKDMKLILGISGALVAGSAMFWLSQMGELSLLLQGSMQIRFNLTGFLILFNTAVVLSFIIHYRITNQFTEVYTEYKERLIYMSSLNAEAREQISRLLQALDPIPLKTHTKRKLKRLLITAFQESGAVSDGWVRAFIRRDCIDMNWIYWSGTVVQWTFLILLGSKLVWALDSGLMVSADYFRQELTTGMVLGALSICGAVLCPLNHGFRNLLYQGTSFSLKDAWLLICLISLCISLILFSGLIPSRFIWGFPVNPAPNPWSFLLLMTLIAIVQFIKNDPRFASE